MNVLKYRIVNKVILWLVVISLALQANVSLAQTPAPPTNPTSTTPIFKEDFEGSFAPDPFCKNGVCSVPIGWGVWFVPRKDTDPEGINFQPQYEQTRSPRRVKSGTAAQRIYAENKTFTGGTYRAITGIKPGTKIRVTAQGQIWSTNDDSVISARPSRDIKLKIGIDPFGGDEGKANAFNGQVVWSSEQDPKDEFKPFSVEVESKSSSIMFYTFASMRDVTRHNEVYWDDIIIEVINPAGVVVTATPLPQPAQTTRSSSGIQHIVKQNETLLGIAQRYNKTIEELRRLNKLSNDRLAIGQELTIEAGATLIQPTTQAASNAISDTAGRGEVTVGVICVLAFFDDNGNGRRDRGEDLVPLVPFNISQTGQTLYSHVTDGVNEPKCFVNLKSGVPYIVAASISPNYNATTVLNNQLNVPAGGKVDFFVGLRKVSDGIKNVPNSATGVSASTSTIAPGFWSVMSLAFGALALFGFAATLISLILRRKRI
jgi:LysM repeat protein